MKPHVMQLLYTLSHGGAERLALTILDGARDVVRGSVCGFCGGSGPLVEAVDTLGLPYHLLKAENKGRLRVLWDLYRMFRRERVDILHVQAGFVLMYAFLPARLAGVDIVYTEHAKHSLETKPLLRHVLHWMVCRVQALTVVSENLKTFFVDVMGCAADRVMVVNNGVDTGRFKPDGTSERGRELPAEGVVIGTVARMSEPKDHANLLRAFQAVRKQRDDVRLVWVGDGEKRPEIEGMIRELGLGDSVILTGRQERVPDYLRVFDVFVLPSKREGAPVSVLEAMACGVPVVATDVGGVSEILHDGVNGRVVPPGDHERLAEAIVWLLDRPETMREFVESGLDAVQHSYSQKTMCDRYAAIYQSLRK